MGVLAAATLALGGLRQSWDEECRERETGEASYWAGGRAGQVREHFAGLGRVCEMGVLAAATLALGELLERRDQDCTEGKIEEASDRAGG